MSAKTQPRAKPLKQQIRIAAMVATGTEDMELIVPVDVWRRARFVVDLVSVAKKNSITLARGTSIKCTHTIEKTNLKQYNAIFLPGGKGHTQFLEEPRLIEAIRRFAEDKEWLLAICAAPIVFHRLDVLGKNKVAAHADVAEELGSTRSAKPIVLSENFLTARAAGHSLEFALKAVECMDSPEVAAAVRAEIN